MASAEMQELYQNVMVNDAEMEGKAFNLTFNLCSKLWI